MTNGQMAKYDILAELTEATVDALDLAVSLCGVNDETFSNILYYYEGYRDFVEFLKDIKENPEDWGLKSEEED